MKKVKGSRKAFSLMELMVVIIILGLLAGLIIPNVVGQGERAKVQLTCVQLKSIKQSLELFKQDNGVYPATEQGLSALITNPDPEIYTSFLEGGYLSGKNLPIDPWKRKYIYIMNEGAEPDLISLGADGKEGEVEENADIKLSTCK